jgi:cytidylate kinase
MTTFAITIGREPGSGGKIIAQQLGKLMNLPVYDKELINMASKDSGLGKEFFEEMDEKVGHSTFGGLFGLRNSLMDEVFSGNYLSHEALFQIQSDVIRKIAASQSVIFVGRCADYVLKNQTNTLNIFISGNREDRIQRISKYESIDKDKASECIEKMDKKRAGYYYYFSNKKWGKATSYHLCINSSVLGIDQTAAFIYEFAKAKFKL